MSLIPTEYIMQSHSERKFFQINPPFGDELK